MKVAKSFFAAAGIMLAIAFNFSCTSSEEGNTFYGCIAGNCKIFSEVSSSSEVVYMCGANSIYDPATHFCQSGSNEVLLLCDGQEYTMAEQCCNNGAIAVATHFCLVIPKCEGFEYDITTHFCQSGTNVLKTRCGGQTYSARKFCQEGTVYDKCDGTLEYAPATHFCQDETTVLPLCDGKKYPATEFCQGGTKVVMPLCGGKEYPASQQCCDKVIYDPVTHICENKIVVPKTSEPPKPSYDPKAVAALADMISGWGNGGTFIVTVDGGNVIVTGGGYTRWSDVLDIPAGVTVRWNANLNTSIDGTDGYGAINLKGSGTLEIIGNTISNGYGYAIAVDKYASPTIVISGGTIHGGVYLSGGGTITVSGNPNFTNYGIYRGLGATVRGYYSNAANKAFFINDDWIGDGWTEGVNLFQR